MKNKLLLVIVAAFCLHFLLLISLRYTAWPEMLAWPYLMVKGWLPYKDIAIVHTPLLLIVLTAFNKIFGVGLWQLKLFSIILVLATDYLIFWVAKKLWGVRPAIFALLAFIPLQIIFEGNGLWFDLALVPLGLLIYYLAKVKKYFWVGIVWALAFLTKQTAVWLLVPIFYSLFKDKTVKHNLKRFIFGIFPVFETFFLIAWSLGISSDVVRWAGEFGMFILPRSAGQIFLPSLGQLAFALAPFLVLVYGLKIDKKEFSSLIVWSVFAALGAYPRWELFHIQPALGFLAIGSGIVLDKILNKKRVLVFSVVYLLIILLLVTKIGMKGTRFFEPEVLEIASYIKQNTSKDQEIYVINAWDSLYPLSETVPATRPLVPHLSWYMEQPGIQEDIVSDLTERLPEIIVVGEFDQEGLGAYKPKKIMDFISQNYENSGKIGKYLIYRRINENFVFKYLPE